MESYIYTPPIDINGNTWSNEATTPHIYFFHGDVPGTYAPLGVIATRYAEIYSGQPQEDDCKLLFYKEKRTTRKKLIANHNKNE